MTAALHNRDWLIRSEEGDGIEVIRQLRTCTALPILVLFARGEEEQKVNVLDAGADDYLTKPFGNAELLARIRVHLRKRPNGGTLADHKSTSHFPSAQCCMIVTSQR